MKMLRNVTFFFWHVSRKVDWYIDEGLQKFVNIFSYVYNYIEKVVVCFGTKKKWNVNNENITKYYKMCHENVMFLIVDI